VIQKKAELSMTKNEIDNLARSLKLTREALEISKKMLAHKVVSKIKYNEQQRELNAIEGSLESKKALLPKIESEIRALQEEMAHTILAFRSEAHTELEKITAQLDRLNEAKNIDKGRIKRALVISPINGTIKKMHYNTLGGVVKPGGVIAEVVPTEEHLIIDTKIEPSKIAFIYTNQKAVVRFSDYDFATYGSLEGEVVSISADTAIDEIDKKHYYTVKIKTTKNYLEKENKKLPIKIGMVATIDIMNGKQSIMDYILNPIIRAKQNMLSNN
jgi:adhesin transport system membrane fusion protein